MAFAISSVIRSCEQVSRMRRISLGAVDFVVIAAVTAVAGLILGGVIQAGSIVAYSFLGIGGVITLMDAVAMAFVSSCRRLAPLEVIGCDEIMPGLYLGSCEAFVNAVNHPTQQFTTIITACPLRDIVALSQGFTLSEQELREKFSRSRVDWHYLPGFPDRPEYWTSLVHDCTHRTQLAQTALPNTQEESDQVCRQKGEVLSNTSVDKWFLPIFKAIKEGRRVLIHCQAGQSRSASILAAYLIGESNKSCDEAVAFLQSKRACVSPKFVPQLKVYENKLREANLK